MPPIATSWNDLPPELVTRILEIRRETMRVEAHDRINKACNKIVRYQDNRQIGCDPHYLYLIG